jgi:hypothetical protein
LVASIDMTLISFNNQLVCCHYAALKNVDFVSPR